MQHREGKQKPLEIKSREERKSTPVSRACTPSTHHLGEGSGGSRKHLQSEDDPRGVHHTDNQTSWARISPRKRRITPVKSTEHREQTKDNY